MESFQFSFAQQSYHFIVPSDGNSSLPVRLCLRNDAAGLETALKEHPDWCREFFEVTVSDSETGEEVPEPFSLLFLAVVAHATDAAVLLLARGAEVDELLDVTLRTQSPAGVEETDHLLVSNVARRCAEGGVELIADFTELLEVDEAVLIAMLDMGFRPRTLHLPVHTPESARMFCVLAKRQGSAAIPPSLSAIGLAVDSGVLDATVVSRIDPDVSVRVCDLALLIIMLYRSASEFRAALEVVQSDAWVVADTSGAWYLLLYNAAQISSEKFADLLPASASFFLTTPPPRAMELHHVGAGGKRPRIYDSRMEKFLAVQMPILALELQEIFVQFWTQKIHADGLLEKRDSFGAVSSHDEFDSDPLGLSFLAFHSERLATSSGTPASGNLSLVEQFQAAASTARKLKVSSNDDKLSLYGFYKQATEGPCTSSGGGVGMFDFAGQAKAKAWRAMGTMAKEEATKSYIELVRALSTG
eukprot:NODE_1588_length_1481_cov_30.609637_g1432_i0.p1 GENE.NODE_1588_length_1481_cov_30.609637_g1432_i0~~NODE_1588_length_1481_cov_30.609637_g1432_i0.p1  ORF type:complete len:473 (+),score=84.70 NODE_1588_length_1481_cov_30.609637_g1432_i0:3-1421(+)